jgi:hypothetical protein
MDKEKKSALAIFGIVALLFFIGMGLYVPAYDDIVQHRAIDDLDDIVYAFDAFFKGDIEGFFDNLFGGITVIAIFMVVFAITHFLFATIFKKTFKKHHATILALLMGVYALINNKIYNYIIALDAFGVGFLVFSALIIMIWGLSKKGFKDTKKGYLEARDARASSKDDKKRIAELKKVMRDMDKE